MEPIHAKCAAYTRTPGGTLLVCSRSRGHRQLTCWDSDEDQMFFSPTRQDFPKIEALGVRKVRRAASDLGEALASLRMFLDPENADCSVPPEVRRAASSYLTTWVEYPAVRALRVLDPYFDALEDDAGN